MWPLRKRTLSRAHSREIAPLFTPDPTSLTAAVPKILWIELTSKCPFDCVFCSRQMRRGTGEHMGFELFCSLIRELDHPEIIRLNYSGESIHYPHLIEAIRLAKSTGAVTELVSAFGSISSQVLHGLVESGLDRLSISLHTLDPKQYETIYRLGTLNRLQEKVQELIELKQQMGTLLPILDFAFVAMSENLSQLGKVAGYASMKGVRELFIHPVLRRDAIPRDFSAELSGNRMTETFRQSLHRTVDLAREEYPAIRFVVCNPQIESENCLTSLPMPFGGELPEGARIHTCDQNPWQTVHVLVNGDVTVCEVQDKVSLGNLKRQSLSEIWQGPQYRQFRERYLHGSVAECRNCPWKVAYLPGPARSFIDAAEGMSPQLLKGWHLQNGENIVWSQQEGLLILKNGKHRSRVRLRGILPHSLQETNCLQVECQGIPLGVIENPSRQFLSFDACFDLATTPTDFVSLKLTALEVFRPSSRSESEDHRDLGFALIRAEVL
jgi:radical SAM protein with 4Fe4S-binding SPASM domain